jgi:hypothetical protein
VRVRVVGWVLRREEGREARETGTL